MKAAQESTSTTQVPAAGRAARFGTFAAVVGLTAAMALGTVAAAGSAQAATVRVPVTQYAACNGGDDTAGLKTAITALKTGD
ncbi:MAG: hypothetical protein ABJD68_19370, partial [Nakamurella sp.]